jgi:hypothetical protein
LRKIKGKQEVPYSELNQVGACRRRHLAYSSNPFTSPKTLGEK